MIEISIGKWSIENDLFVLIRKKGADLSSDRTAICPADRRDTLACWLKVKNK